MIRRFELSCAKQSKVGGSKGSKRQPSKEQSPTLAQAGIGRLLGEDPGHGPGRGKKSGHEHSFIDTKTRQHFRLMGGQRQRELDAWTELGGIQGQRWPKTAAFAPPKRPSNSYESGQICPVTEFYGHFAEILRRFCGDFE